MRRRTLLGSVTTALTAMAGCTSPSGTEGTTDESETTQRADETDAVDTTDEVGGTTTPAEQTTAAVGGADELDLREANVTAVTFEKSGDDYRFSVTLLHDDDGEDGYANWWVVESLDGAEFGKRELLHAHGTQEFTRSETISVPDGTTCVVVRGHDQTHGYGGQAMLVNLESGATRAERQGPEPKSFADATC